MKPDVGAADERDRSRWASPRTAESLFVVAMLLLIAAIPLSAAAHQLEAGFRQVLLMLPFALVGVVVARRRPGNPIGWLMLLIAPVSTLGADGGLYGVVAFRMGHPDLPLARLGVALTVGWIAVLLLLPLPILLFPDGALPSPRWRWTVWAYLADSVVLLAALAVKDVAAFTDKVVVVGSFGELHSLSGNAKGTSAAVVSLAFLVLLVGIYVGMVTLATRALPLSSPVGVAASTLTVAALFTPLRRRAQRIVDRRFNRAGYDADATIASFAARLRDEVDLERVQRDLLDVVRRAVEPAHVTVWIRSHG